MKLPEFGFLEKCKIVGKTLLVQVCLFITLLLLAWGSQALYAKLDRTEFPTPVQITDADKLDENAKGKALVDAITHQMRYELDSTFGWSINDILFNRFVLDNRAYRQYGVYHATKVLMDLYSMTIAKLGTNDRESEMLYKARLNSFAIDPRSFMFPSAESSYKKGLKLIEQYKESLDKGTGVYNCRTDDLYASFDLVIGENLLGYALGLLENSQELPFYTLDNRIYEVQGIVLVVRDFISALYELYPEISSKGNAGNMAALTSMEKLTLVKVNVEGEPFSLSGLARLSNLSSVRINDSQIADFEALAGCSGLTYVEMKGSKGISSLAPLKALPNLKRIIVSKGAFPDAELSGFAQNVKVEQR